VQKYISISKVPANTGLCCCMPNEKHRKNGSRQRFLCNTIHMYGCTNATYLQYNNNTTSQTELKEPSTLFCF